MYRTIYSNQNTCNESIPGIDWSGSSDPVAGGVHTNGTLKMGGSSNTVTPDKATYDCQKDIYKLDGSGGQQTSEYIDWPATYSTSQFTCTYGSLTSGGDRDYGSSGSWWQNSTTLKPGVYCAQGNLLLSRSNTTGNGVVFVANGTIEISGSDMELTSTHSTHVLMFSTRSGSSTPAIKMSGSNSNTLVGLMYAPNGLIEISGSSHTFTSTTGVAWGVWVKMNGSNSSLSATGREGSDWSTLSE